MNLPGKIVFSSGRAVDFDIFSLDLSSGAISQLTSGDNLNDFPRWSPDGTRVAYICTESDSIPSVWVMDSSGANRRKLTEAMYCQCPAWSPDGETIIFTANGVQKTEIDVCAVPASGGAVSRVFSYDGLETNPIYSPDGKKILFSGPAKNSDGTRSHTDTDIIEYDIALASFRTLAGHPAKDYSPAYSPDGKRIAFVSHRNDRNPTEYHEALANLREVLVNGDNASARDAMRKMRDFEADGDVFRIDSDGTNLVQLTHDGYADKSVSWSPDGRYLVYTSSSRSENETERLKVIDAESGKRVSLKYDRSSMESEIEASSLLNFSFFQKIIPNFIERHFIDYSFWGEERHPHWGSL